MRALTLAGTLMLLSASTLAAQTGPHGSGMPMRGMSGMMGASGAMMGGTMGMHGMHGMMGGIKFPHLLMKAQRVAPEKADALRELSEKRMPAWIRQMAEVHIAMLQLSNRLQDPGASAQDIRSAFDRLNQEKQKLQALNRDAILELRRVLGPETFTRLVRPMGSGGMTPSPRMMDMMQRMGNMPMMPSPSGSSRDGK